jgi:hypothetical protein
MNYNLNTGDVILYCGSKRKKTWFSIFSSLIRYATHSYTTHIGMIVKDPDFTHTKLEGIYVWESGWEGTADPEDGKIKLGVQLTPIDQILKDTKKNNIKLVTRKLNCPENTFTTEKLKEISSVVNNKPYDINPRDWFYAIFDNDENPQKTDSFWCSALIGYIYTKLGILENTTDWSILKPSDFSLESENLNFNKDFSLDNSEIQINP